MGGVTNLHTKSPCLMPQSFRVRSILRTLFLNINSKRCCSRDILECELKQRIPKDGRQDTYFISSSILTLTLSTVSVGSTSNLKTSLVMVLSSICILKKDVDEECGMMGWNTIPHRLVSWPWGPTFLRPYLSVWLQSMRGTGCR